MSTKKTPDLVKELYAFADKPDSLMLRSFIIKHKMSYDAFTRLLVKDQALKEAFEYARLAIGARREEKALKNELNAKMVSESMALYDPERREWEETKLKLGKMEQKIGLDTIRAITQKLSEG